MELGSIIGAIALIVFFFLLYKSLTTHNYSFKYGDSVMYANSCYSSWWVTKRDGTKFRLKVIHDKNGRMYMDGVSSVDGKEYITLADLRIGAYDGKTFHKEVHEKFVYDYLKQKELYL